MRQAGLIGRFGRSGVEPLHADADAEERNAARDRGANRRGEAGIVETSVAAKWPTPGSTMRSADSTSDKIAVGHLDLRAEMAQRLEHRGEIAGFVIDDGYAHQSSPLVEGSISPSCLSREQATRRARAKALKMASIL